MADRKKRCEWCLGTDFERDYHDQEWGVPLHDDRLLFEHLTLDGAQAGLSWLTILKKREGYREAFDNFNVEKIARYRKAKVERLLTNPAIVRNRLKVESTVSNAKAFLKVQQAEGSFDAYFWNFVDGKPIQNKWTKMAQIPATSDLSDVVSKDLKRRGFKFVGSTICYALMQAIGMINDHTVDCHRYRAVKRLASEK